MSQSEYCDILNKDPFLDANESITEELIKVLSEPLKIYCEEYKDTTNYVVNSKKNIFVKNEVPINFILDNIEQNSEVIIKATFEHVDHMNIPILPCQNCSADYVFSVAPSTYYSVQYVSKKQEDTVVKVTFLQRHWHFKPLQIIFHCSAIHKFQNTRFSLLFLLKDKIVALFLVKVTASPVRCSKTAKSKIIKDEEWFDENDSEEEVEDKYEEGECQVSVDLNEPPCKMLKPDSVKEEESSQFLLFIQNEDQERLVKKILTDRKKPFDIWGLTKLECN